MSLMPGLPNSQPRLAEKLKSLLRETSHPLKCLTFKLKNTKARCKYAARGKQLRAVRSTNKM